MSTMSNGNHAKDGAVPLLVDNLPLYSSKAVHQVAVTSEKITCTPVSAQNKKSTELFFIDITGCDCMKGQRKDDDAAYLTVYAYPHKKKFASKNTLRQRTTLTMVFNREQSFEKNMKEASKWKHLIQCLLKRISISSSQDLCNLEVPAAKKYLVFINPFSGSGKALSMFKQRAVPMFAEAGIHYKTVITEYAGHAREIIQKSNLDEWDGIVIVSGDGLVFEIINGLMSRPDWEKAIKTPMGALPGGSGNALCCALNYLAREPYMDHCFLHSTFLLTKQIPRAMDLVAVDTCKERLYSFLAITWGIIADVDIESERYRSLGGARFTVGALVRIVGLRKYRGRLSFLPVNKYERPPPKLKHSRSADMESTLQDKSAVLTRSQSQVEEWDHASKGKTRSRSQPAMSALLEDHAGVHGMSSDEVFAENRSQRANSEENGKEPEEKATDFVANGDLERVPENEEDEENDRVTINVPVLNGNATTDDQSEDSASVPTPLLPPLDEPVPEDWVTLEDDFVFILAVYLSHLGADNIAVKNCQLDEGVIHLGIGRGSLNRQQVLKLFTSMSEGNLEASHDFEIFPVKAFRLEPITPKGIITVDGEKVDYGPIQAQVLPSVSRVMTLPPK